MVKSILTDSVQHCVYDKLKDIKYVNSVVAFVII